jgi:hypothetical protein
MKGCSASTPSTDAKHAYTADYLLGWTVASLKGNHRNSMTKAHKFAAEGLYVSFKPTDDRSVEVGQLEYVHQSSKAVGEID